MTKRKRLTGWFWFGTTYIVLGVLVALTGSPEAVVPLACGLIIAVTEYGWPQ